MEKLEKTITEVEYKLEQLEKQRKATSVSMHSSEYLHENLQFVMEHLDKVSADAQIQLLQALIKEVEVHQDHINLKLYVNEERDDTLKGMKPEKEESPDEIRSLIAREFA